MPSSDDDSVSCSSGDPSPDSCNESEDDSEFSHGGIIKGSDESDSESGGSSDEMSVDDEEGEEEEEEDPVDQSTKDLWDSILTLIASGETADPTNKKFLPANKKLEELETLYTRVVNWGGPNSRVVWFLRQMRLHNVAFTRVETPFSGKGESGSERLVCALTGTVLNRQNGVRIGCVSPEGKVAFQVLVLKTYLPIIENAVAVFQVADIVQTIVQLDDGVFSKQSPESVGQLTMPSLRRCAPAFSESFSGKMMRVVNKGCDVINILLNSESSVFESSHPL